MTLEKLIALGIKYFRTDEQGIIVVKSTTNDLTFNTEPNTSMAVGTNDSGQGYQDESQNQADNTQATSSTKAEATTQKEEPDNNSGDSSTYIVHITNTGEKYHSAGYQYLKKSDIEVTLDSAKAQGYTPCSKCNPPR